MGELAVIDDIDAKSDAQIDKIIWKNAGILSVRDLARKTGLSPDHVLRRKNQLFDEVDVLTVQQHRQKLTIDMQRIANDAQKSAENAPLEFRAGLLNSAIAAIKTVLGQLDKQTKGEQTVVDKLNERRVQELLSIVRDSVDISVAQVAELYGLDENELFELFNANLKVAAANAEARNAL